MKEIIEKAENNTKGHLIRNVLEEEIKKSSNVFIMGHNRPDFDSIGSSIGILELAKYYGKDAYIIMNDNYFELDNDIKKIVKENRDELNLIKNYEYNMLKDDNSLFIFVDVNKKIRIDNDIAKNIDDIERKIIIDHHDFKENESIENAINLIYPTSSSASELISQAIISLELDSDFKLSDTAATLLYSGIELDTNRFKARTTNVTHSVADKLLEYGADKEYINNLFRNDRATYNVVGNLIINGSVINQYTESFKQLGICFTLNRDNPSYIYKQEELAKASDVQVGFKDTDAAFSLGYIKEGLVSVSARSSTASVNVGKIMEQLHGGGNATSAGTQIETNDIFSIEKEIMQKVEDFLSLQETPVVELVTNIEEQPRQFIKRRKK